MGIALENVEQTSKYEIVQLKIKMNKKVINSYSRKDIIRNTLYGFDDLDEIISFMEGTYTIKENVNTVGNHTLTLNNFLIVEYLSYGEYVWIEFTADSDSFYKFITYSDYVTKIKIYKNFGSNYV